MQKNENEKKKKKKEEEEEEEYREVLLSLDPGWKNLGWILSVFSRKEKKLVLYHGTYDTKIPHTSSDPVSYVIGISNFLSKKILPKLLQQPSSSSSPPPFRVIALVIEQQPKKAKKYTKHELLQQMLEAIVYTHLAKQDSTGGKHFLIHRFSAVSTKKVFGVWRKGASYSERKLEMLERIQQLASGPIEERERFPLIIPIETDHEADALAGLNVYINRAHNHELYDVGIYKKEKTQRKRSKNASRSKEEHPAKKKRNTQSISKFHKEEESNC